MYLQFLYSLHFPFFSLSSVFFLLLQSLYPRKGGKNPLPLQPERQTFKPRRRIVQSFRADSRMERNKSTSRRGAARGCSYIAKKKIPSGHFNSRIPLSSTSFHVSFKDRPSKRSVFSISNKVFSPLPFFFFEKKKLLSIAVIIVMFVGGDDKVVVANKVAVRYFIYSRLINELSRSKAV